MHNFHEIFLKNQSRFQLTIDITSYKWIITEWFVYLTWNELQSSTNVWFQLIQLG